ncbi:MAG TPA: alpha-glucosidase C-terminal domain-containing protein, partial [Candidatus Limnocylindrales bacterium]
MAIRMEDRLPIVDIIEQTPAIPDTAQWALFLRNHDELTLEMVTDEERDYMYRTYADDPRARINLGIRRRLAPLLGNHRRRIELMNGLLFSLPGTPVIYYGDEIGMGDNVYLGDRDSVRTPMQWNGDRNAGFSTADREQLFLPVVTDPEHHFEAVNVSVQQANPHSLLWWNKRLIALRKRHPAFGRGDLRMLHPENRHVLAFVRSFGDETILVVANLSRFFQPVELDLATYEGRQPIEMFGRIEFPAIGRASYPLSLGPHEFLWFTLEPVAGGADGGLPASAVPALTAAQMTDILGGRGDSALISVLLRWIKDRAWYRGRGRRVRDGTIVDRIDVRPGVGTAVLIVLQVNYSDGEPDTYLIPLTTAVLRDDSLLFADGTQCRVESPGTRIAALAATDGSAEPGFLVDASADEGLTAHLVDAIGRSRRVRGSRGELYGRRSADLPAEQPDLVLELRHAFEPGKDPEAEVMSFLTGHGANWAPRVFGELEYRPGDGPRGSAALLRERLVHDGDVAGMTREALLGFLEQAAATPAANEAPSITAADLIRTAAEELPAPAHDLVGSYLTTARSIGNRIGDLHAVMASEPDDPDFAPELFTRQYQRSLYQSIDASIVRVTRHLEARSAVLESSAATDAQLILRRKAELRDRLRMLVRKKFTGARIRIHGDLRLSQVMRGERGPVLIDFEGDAGRPASERRLKRSALRDVAGMVHSFHDVALGRLRESDVGGSLRSEDAAALDVWARQWFLWVGAAFLRGYRETTGDAAFLPAHEDEWACLLDAFLIQRLLEDLDADLRDDPARVASSLRGLLELLGL